MQIIAFIFFALSSFAVMIYCLLFLRNTTGWLSIQTFIPKKSNQLIKLTVIVSARNESKNIERCLQSLTEQTYPQSHLQIIVVDDHSTDDTANKILPFTKTHSQISLVNATHSGKKAAITQAIQLASGSLIVTSDADCVYHPNWLNTIASYYFETGAKMIVGPVCFYNEQTVFEKMQSAEFAGLIGLSAAAIQYNAPVMCNGANLAYEKNVFVEVNGFEGIDKNPSGDDILLMQKIRLKYSEKIKFLKNEEAIVQTTTIKSLREFIDQRSRWVSKTFVIFNWPTFLQGAVIFSANLLLLLSLLFSMFNPSYLKAVVFLFVIKALFDFLFVFLSCRFVHKSRYAWLVFIIQPFYGIYLLTTSVRGFWGTKTWKDRTFR